MKTKLGSLILFLMLGFGTISPACINDSKTLGKEKHDHPTLAKAILSPTVEQPDVKSLTQDIQKLKANPNTNDPAWWNELAGAYLRLGQPAEAVKLLEPVTNRFASDYGVHANLGTAYHLLGRYADAEKEIRRDLEINPDAHFGLEKYHLALLQYLSRDAEYQFRHVYVDEFTAAFLKGRGMMIRGYEKLGASERNITLDNSERKSLEPEAQKFLQSSDREVSRDDAALWVKLAMADPAPEYMDKWDLFQEPKREDGVIYMATLNPREPACKVMLGMLAWSHRDVHLAQAAFQQAIDLGSPQKRLLQGLITHLNKYHSAPFGIPWILWCMVGLIGLIIAFYIFCKWQEFRRKPM